MKKPITLVFIIMVLVLNNCSTKQETPFEFATKFTKGMKANSQSTLESLFVSTRTEIKKMVKALKENKDFFRGETLEEQVDLMVKSVNEDIPKMLDVIKDRTIQDWSMLELKSAEFQDVTTINADVKIEDGAKAGYIFANYLFENEPYKIRIEVIELGDGKWMMVDYPRKVD